VVANFILPMQQQRDVDPDGEVARYDYDKLLRGMGMDFHSELLNFQEKVARLPTGVRVDPAYWINRIKEKTSDGLLASFERQVKEEVKTGNGGAHSMTPINELITSGLLSIASCRKPSMSRNDATQKQNLDQSPALLASQRIVDLAWKLGGASSLEDVRVLEDASYCMRRIQMPAQTRQWSMPAHLPMRRTLHTRDTGTMRRDHR
jgi:hypothetical protein